MTDERDLDDPALAAAWRTQSAETPPAALDDAILAAAHRAVKSAPAKISPGSEATRPWRWWAPLAAAATIGVIAIGALQLMPHEHDITTTVISDMPASSPAPVDAFKDRKVEAASERAIVPASPPPASAQPAPAPQPFPARKDAAAAKPSAPQAGSERRAAGSAFALAPTPAAEAPSERARPKRDERQIASENAEGDRVGALGKLAAPSQAAPRAAAQAAAAPAPRTPEEWIARIRALMVAADMAEANRALTAFRAAYRDADARLPADLRPWAATVPR